MTKTRNISDLLDANGDVKSGALDNVANAVAPTRHSIRPSLNLDFANSKALDPRITFTRASNATYYDGYTSVKAEENLLKYSQEFDNAEWNKNSVTVTANDTTAPDGTTTAELITENVTGSLTGIYITQDINAVIGNEYTVSVFAKRNGRDCQIAFGGGDVTGNPYANFDLSTGTLGTTSGTITASITDAGNSWYRCSATITSAVTSLLVIFVPSTSTSAIRLSSHIGDGTSGIYLWGAQVEQRDSLTAYTPTTDAPITKYQPVLQTAINNTARFDHNPTTGESLGLLIEESRTNLIPYSEEFDNAVWTKGNATITANTIIAPDGTLTGDKLVENTATSTHGVQKTGIAVTVGVTYTMSAFIKKGERTTATISCSTSRLQMNTTFDLEAGTVVSSSASSSTITNVGNGWYRVTATNTLTSAGAVAPFILLQTFSPYTGDGYSGIYIWGIQLEAGSFPTSYIKTTASQVTRSVDDAKILDITDWYNYNEGTIYAEAIGEATNEDSAIFGFDDGTANNQIHVGFKDDAIRTYCITNNSTQSVLSTSYDGSLVKVATTHSTNDVAFTANGISTLTDTAQIMPNVTQVGIGNRAYQNTFSLTGTIKKIAYYPKKLTDNEIIDLTEE